MNDNNFFIKFFLTKHIVSFKFTGEEEILPGVDFGNNCNNWSSGPIIKESKPKATNEKSRAR